MSSYFATIDEIEDAIERFDMDGDCEIYQALGWTRGEWRDFVQHDIIPMRPLRKDES